MKFLVDNGHITASAVVETFSVDRDGNLRVRVMDDGNMYNYGLEESEDTYQITYMQKKRAPKSKITNQNNE